MDGYGHYRCRQVMDSEHYRYIRKLPQDTTYTGRKWIVKDTTDPYR